MVEPVIDAHAHTQHLVLRSKFVLLIPRESVYTHETVASWRTEGLSKRQTKERKLFFDLDE